MRTSRLIALASTCAMSSVASAGFSYAFFFGMPSDVILQGDAIFQDEIRLTTGGGQHGAMWQQNKHKVDTGFIDEFRFRMDPGPLQIPGDGFACVIQDSGAGTTALGEGGSGIGYSGIERSVAVEFDTFWFDGEFPGPHISIQTNGGDANDYSDAASIAHVYLPDLGIDILDGRDHTGAVQYTPPNYDNGTPGLMQVFVDYRLVLEANIDLHNVRFDGDNITDDDGDMYVGFTAATGLADSTHALGSWAFEEDVQGCLSPYWYVGGTGWGGPGSDFSMGVEYMGTMPLSFHWYKDGSEITDDQGGHIEGLGTSQLVVHDIHLPDAGHYYLVAQNACGEGTSFDWGLRVCDANINCDGSVDFFDYLDFVTAFAALDAGLADFNYDGSIDFFDYLDFVNAFTQPCE